jgi:tetratricopeptide (TPR) repeat protein
VPAVATTARDPLDGSSACPSEDALARFLSGEASPRERASIERHLDACERCATTFGLYGGTFIDTPEPSVADAVPGPRRFAARYQIRECVGFGSGGTVYRAYDPELERIVALKVLDPGGGGTTQPAHRWTREAKVMAKVVHPNVVTVHDVGVADDNVFIATEFVEGSTLDQWLSAAPRSWREIVGVFTEAGNGLVAIHDCGLVHRDFKPHNVMVGRDGRVRVTDFGLARIAPELDTEEELTTGEMSLNPELLAETVMSRTRTGTVVGTPRYMPPEQWRGRKADARSDQFSFCVALYEAIWGRRPYEGETAVDLAEAVCEGEAAPPPASPRVPRWLSQAVMRGLSRDPDERFPSMRGLLHALTEAPKRARRRMGAAVLGLGFLGVAAVGYGVASLPEDTCRPDVQRFAGVWDDARREAVRASLAAEPLEVIAEVEREIDARVEEWQQASVETCEAMRDTDATAQRHRELQVDCLDRLFVETKAVTGVLAEADPATAAKAVEITRTIGSATKCADTTTLATIEPEYADPLGKQLAHEVAADLTRIEALRIAGRHDDAHELAQALAQRVGEDAELAVRAEVLNALGLVQSARKEPAVAEKTLRDAVWAAEASGHVEAAATAWVELVNVVGIQREHYADGIAAAERADAVVHRLHDTEKKMQLASHRAVLESMNGNYEAALAQHERVLEDAVALYGPDDERNVARVHLNLAAVLSKLGRLDEALDHARTGLRIHDARFPEPHPVAVEMLNSIGALELQRGDDEAARIAFERGVAIAEATLPSDSVARAAIISNLGQLDLRSGRVKEAQARQEEVLRIYRAAHGNAHPDVALALHNLAGIQDRAGEREAAIATYRAALKLRIETVGAEHPGTAGTQHNLGLMLSSGTGPELDEGIELMERALAIREAAALDPFYRATTSFMLARAYAKRGDDRKALERAHAARDHMRSIAPRHPEILDAIDKWLAAREG